MDPMSDKKKTGVREMVSRAYAKALERATQGGGCCGPKVPAGQAAQLAGYDEELEKHGDAGGSSFGCGNPLAFAGVNEGETVIDLGSGDARGTDALMSPPCGAALC